jgi:hypothetical protein
MVATIRTGLNIFENREMRVVNAIDMNRRYKFKLAEELFENGDRDECLCGKKRDSAATHPYDETCPNKTDNCSNGIQDYTGKPLDQIEQKFRELRTCKNNNPPHSQQNGAQKTEHEARNGAGKENITS